MTKLLTITLIGLTWVVLTAQSGFAVSVSETDIQDRVTAFVQEQLADTIHPEFGDELTITPGAVNSAPFDFDDAGSMDEVSFKLSSPLSKHYSARAIVRVRMTDPSGRQRVIGVPVQLTVTKPIWVVKNNVQAKQRISRQDVELDVRDVSQILNNVAGQEEDITQYVTRVNLQAGRVLDMRRLQRPPAVKRNGDVQVFISNGQGLNISVWGVALADASVGDQVRVRYGQFKRRKYYTGTVIQKNRVKVTL